MLSSCCGPPRAVPQDAVADRLAADVQTTAALALPTINARIIDNGVIPGDIAYIWTWGGVMLGFAFVQIVFAIAAVYFGGKVAMSFGRDLRNNLFHQVTDFSAREVGRSARRR